MARSGVRASKPAQRMVAAITAVMAAGRLNKLHLAKVGRYGPCHVIPC